MSGHAGIIVQRELHPRLGSMNQVKREPATDAIDFVEYRIRARELDDFSPIAFLRHDLIEIPEQLVHCYPAVKWVVISSYRRLFLVETISCQLAVRGQDIGACTPFG